MIRLSELHEKWREDCQIDQILLDQTTLEIPVRHSRWLELHHDSKTQLRKLETIKKSYSMKDRKSKEYSELVDLIEETKQSVEMTAECIAFLNRMSYSINNIIKWRQFSTGVDAL